MGTGCEEVFCEKTDDFHFVSGKWKDGRIGTMRGIRKGTHEYGATVFGGEKVYQVLYSKDIPLYSQLLKEIIKFFKTGIPPVSKEETLEIMKFIEAALLSEREKRVVKLSEVEKS